MKKILSVILSVLLCIVNVPNISYAEEQEYSDMSDEEYATEVIAEIMEINRYLNEFGVNLDDFKELSQKSPEFYK